MTSKKNFTLIVALVVAGIVATAFAWWRISKTARVAQTGVGAPSPLAGPAKPPPEVGIFFTTSLDNAKGGDFSFRYSSNLLLSKDSLVKGGKSGETHHFVVLKDRFGVEPGATIEINAPAKTCADYGTCKEVVGTATSTNSSSVVGNVVIGTNSKNKEFLGWFDGVVKTFKVLPPSSSPLTPPKK